MGNECAGKQWKLVFLFATFFSQWDVFCPEEGKEFNWKIEGFSSLLRLESPIHFSREFEAGGYPWMLWLNPKNLMTDDGKCYISLYLMLAHPLPLPRDMAVEAVFMLQIHDQIHGNNHEMKDTKYFTTTHSAWGFPKFICLEKFERQTSGLLINDSCVFGVKFFKIQEYKLKPRDISEWLSLRKEMISGTYMWKIEEFSKLPVPYRSESFIIGNLKWHLDLFREGEGFNTVGRNHLSICLVLEDSIKDVVYVGFSVSMRDQINGEHKKFIGQGRFGSKKNSYACLFLSYEDFFNPSNGFFVESSCMIEARVTIAGSVLVP